MLAKIIKLHLEGGNSVGAFSSIFCKEKRMANGIEPSWWSSFLPFLFSIPYFCSLTCACVRGRATASGEAAVKAELRTAFRRRFAVYSAGFWKAVARQPRTRKHHPVFLTVVNNNVKEETHHEEI